MDEKLKNIFVTIAVLLIVGVVSVYLIGVSSTKPSGEEITTTTPEGTGQETPSIRAEIKSVNLSAFSNELEVYISPLLGAAYQPTGDESIDALNTRRVHISDNTMIEKITIGLNGAGDAVNSTVLTIEPEDLSEGNEILVVYQNEDSGLLTGVESITLIEYQEVE